MKKVKVFSPATLSNIGPGYDIFGLALEHIGDTIEMSWREDGQIIIDPIEGFENLPLNANDNIAGIVAQNMLKDQEINKGLNISIQKNVMPGSGLGSSGSSAAGTAYALNELLNKPYDKLKMIDFAMQGEGVLAGKAHADNVAPSIMGGFTIVKSYDPLKVINIPFPENMFIALVHPQVVVKTSEARKLLPTSVELDTLTQQGGNIASMVAGMISHDYELIADSMRDLVAEPKRASLIPAYLEAKNLALFNGAIGSSISGSGPSIFAFTKSKEDAEKIISLWSALYKKHQIASKTYISKINKIGCKTL